MARFIEVPRVVRSYGDQGQFKEVWPSIINADLIADVPNYKKRTGEDTDFINITMADGRVIPLALSYAELKTLLMGSD